MKIPILAAIQGILLLACLPAYAQKNAPKLPDFKKVFKNDVQFNLIKANGRTSYQIATNDELGPFKQKLLKALGKDWSEVPMPPIPKLLPPGTKDPFADKKNTLPAIIGIARFGTGTKERWHLQLILSKSPIHGKNHTAEITLWKVQKPKK